MKEREHVRLPGQSEILSEQFLKNISFLLDQIFKKSEQQIYIKERLAVFIQENKFSIMI
jgi:hypothetical protein